MGTQSHESKAILIATIVRLPKIIVIYIHGRQYLYCLLIFLLIIRRGIIMKRVLIVDDAAFMRLSLKSMLEKNGFEVVGQAENGMIGAQKYAQLKPDVVTMDITMPELDGIGALKEIKKNDPNAKVVIISAMGQEALIREAVIAGAKTFIVKPFKEEFMIKTLSQVLGI